MPRTFSKVCRKAISLGKVKMKQEELEKELNEKKLNSIYILYGEETFLLETALKKIKKLFGETLIRHKLY